MLRSVHIDILSHELTIVLVGSEHIGFDTFFASLSGNGTDDVVSLKSIHLKDGDMVSFEDVFDDRYREFDVFWCLFTLCLIGRESFMTEGFAMVESHSDMGRFLLGQDLVEGIAEAHDT